MQLFGIASKFARNAKDWRSTVPGVVWCGFCLYYGHANKLPLDEIGAPFLIGVWLIGGVDWSKK